MQAASAFATCLLASVGGNTSAVAFPNQANYSTLVAPYNFDLLTTPSAIVWPQDTQQVAAAVKCAVDSDIKIQPKSGGHNYGNYGSTTSELSVNLDNLQHFSMDETSWTARLGPGNRLGRVTELMYNNGGRHVPHGTTFTVGLGGHATVGGAGAASRMHGLLLDYVEEVEVVLANSSIVRASKSHNEELFFAVRGAASSVGIVTDFSIRTEPVPASSVTYSYVWEGTDPAARAEVFLTWQSLLAGGSLPQHMAYDLVVTANSMILGGAYFGSQEEFEAFNLSSHFKLAPDVTHIKTWTNFFDFSAAASAQTEAAGIASPSHFYAKSLVFNQQTLIPDDTAEKVFKYLATTKNCTDLYAVTFAALGGAVRDVSPSETAFYHRDASYFMFSFGRTSGSLTDTTVQFLDGLSKVLTSGQPDAYYGQYVGNVDPRQPTDKALTGYYGKNLHRLQQVKSAVDPNDVFHNQQSIPPLP